MATTKDLKSRLRAHVEQRLRDFRDLNGRGGNNFYADVAYGSVWAANLVDAITDKERDEYLAELNLKRVEA